MVRHDGGVVDSPGMYLIGAPFLRRRKSSFIDGACDDAQDLIVELARFLDGHACADEPLIAGRGQAEQPPGVDVAGHDERLVKVGPGPGGAGGEERLEHVGDPEALPAPPDVGVGADGGDAVLLGDHPQPDLALVVVVVVEDADDVLEVADAGDAPALPLLRHPPAEGGGEQLLLRAEPGVQRLDAHAGISGDVAQPDRLVGQRREPLPRGVEEPAAVASACCRRRTMRYGRRVVSSVDISIDAA